MSGKNDLEGQQDQGGKHGGQADNKACRGRSRVPAPQTIKALSAISAAIISRATSSERSKSADATTVAIRPVKNPERRPRSASAQVTLAGRPRFAKMNPRTSAAFLSIPAFRKASVF
jgi:hypothetical protein